MKVISTKIVILNMKYEMWSYEMWSQKSKENGKWVAELREDCVYHVKTF